jgi:hypothetical protein
VKELNIEHCGQVHILEVPDSNLGPETSYPGWGFSWCSSDPPEKYKD